jgi:hypothetical protein
MLMPHHPLGSGGQPTAQVGTGHRSGPTGQNQTYRLDSLGDIRRPRTPACRLDETDVSLTEDPEGFSVALALPSRQQMVISDRWTHGEVLPV